MGEYKQIEDYEGYFINEDGNILSTKRVKPIILKPFIAGNGYYEVILAKDKKYKRFGVHVLVAKAFIDNPDNKKFVNHKNGNTLDYSIDNLEWVTGRENKLHAIYELKKRTHTQKCISVDGVLFESLKQCADFYNVSHKNLSSQLMKGVTPRFLRGKTVTFK